MAIMIRHVFQPTTTKKQVFQAQGDGAVVDFTGATLALKVWDRTGASVTPTGTVAWNDIATGKWEYTPDGQLTEALSPYSVRLEITLAGELFSSPSGRGADIWDVVEP